MNLKLILAFLLVSFSIVFSQNPKPCSVPESKQFDFWIGDWKASWADTASGSNSISKILGGCVIYEQFSGSSSSPLVGKSVSVYNSRTGKWHQTWVDNQGGYLDFEGQWEGDKMVLSRTFELKGKKIMQRMIWFNISADKFDWNWERSDDDGTTWKIVWPIHYTRK